MSTEKILQLTHELIGLCAELQSLQAKAFPIVQELQQLGVQLPPEVQAMLLAMKPKRV